MCFDRINLNPNPKVADVCLASSNSVFVLPLPLSFVVVGVAAVQLIEHLSDSHLQPGRQKLDILLHTHVQDRIDALSQMQLHVWSQSNLDSGGDKDKGQEFKICPKQSG